MLCNVLYRLPELVRVIVRRRFSSALHDDYNHLNPKPQTLNPKPLSRRAESSTCPASTQHLEATGRSLCPLKFQSTIAVGSHRPMSGLTGLIFGFEANPKGPRTQRNGFESPSFIILMVFGTPNPMIWVLGPFRERCR